MSTRVALPDEAPDMTATELHEAVLFRLVGALQAAFRDAALVLSEIFLRTRPDVTRESEQVSADVMVIPGARPGRRRVYWVPDEPVPAVTIEILSPVNRESEGRAQLEHKRELFGRLGVPTHIELDPDRGTVTVWEDKGGVLVPVGPPGDSYEGPALGGVRVALRPGEARIYMPDGREYLGAAEEAARAEAEAARAKAEAARAEGEAARAEAEAARAEAEAARAEAEAARAERYLGLLRQHGIDPGAPTT
jgi:Uma2 family endonuclease